MIEISGLPALVALLAPFAVLLVVILWLRRPPSAPEPSAPQAAAEVFRAVPPLDTLPPAADVAPAPAPPVDWAARVAGAEAAGDQRALASAYLAYARAELAAGRTEAAAGHLRTSLRAATQGRSPALQAEARLELAELARAAGDLTTACEHWQIARSLFHDLADAARLGETERLMRQHGCPTDWVLNDF